MMISFPLSACSKLVSSEELLTHEISLLQTRLDQSQYSTLQQELTHIQQQCKEMQDAAGT